MLKIRFAPTDESNNVAEDDTADDFFIDENALELTQLMENLRGEIKFDESVATKSAMLLKLLEVNLALFSQEKIAQCH